MVGKWVVALTAVILVPQMAQAQDRESTLFLDRVPTVEELIDALTPDGGSRGIQIESNIQTEGITIVPIDTDPLSAVASTTSQVTVTDVGLRIQFAFDSAELTPAAKAELDIFATAMASDTLRDSLFVVEGHTDSIGVEAYNQWLSELRAQAARRYLVEQRDITPDRLSAIGLGERKPLPGLPSDAPDNRRVHFATAWQGS